jgi:predicted metal-dependent phosphoesterase TrpH
MKFDLHIHSCYSKNLSGEKIFGPSSKSMPEDIIKTAICNKIGVIAVTDHDNVEGGLRTYELAQRKFKDDILVIPGVEVSSKDGHILAYNVYKDIPKGLPIEETLDLIDEAGGLAVAAHPFNLKYSINKKLATKFKNRLAAYEISNSRSLANGRAMEYIKARNYAFTVGSDAHSLAEIGLCYGQLDQRVNDVREFWDAIQSKKVSFVHTYDKRLIQRAITVGTSTFLYWKKIQIYHALGKSVFLPYLEKNVEE